MDKKPELLAPAGDFDALEAAITNGADAVYLGLGAFSARAQAKNFSLESLKDACDYAHLFDAKVYLAINTLIKKDEMPHALDAASKAWDSGVSAIIVQDLGFASSLKKQFPNIVLHASTQMGVHNRFGAEAAQNLGIQRLILSRETTLSDIIDIKKNTTLELECFVHGALCCGFSGACYFSSLVAARSGNRGRCLQLCRKKYELNDKNLATSGYWLSTRDIMLVRDLKRLAEAGVCSFKIEGRMRRKEYVSETVRVYRKAIDNMGKQIAQSDIDNLKLMFSRGGFSRAHIFGVDNSIIYPQLQSHMGLKIGTVKAVKKDKAQVSSPLKKGDGLKFIRAGSEVGHALVLQDGSETGFVGSLRVGDSVHLTDSTKYNAEINARKQKLPLQIGASFDFGKKQCTLTLRVGKRTKEFCYEVDLQIPQKAVASHDEIADCLTALGGTHFECVSLKIDIDQPFFAAKSTLKELRRTAIADFTKYLITSFARPNSIVSISDAIQNTKQLKVKDNCTIIMCEPCEANEYQNYADYIVLKPADYAQFLSDIKTQKFHVDKDKYILDLPQVAFVADLKVLEQLQEYFDAVMTENIYGIAFAAAFDKSVILGYKTNMLNDTIPLPKVMSIEQAHEGCDDFVYLFGKPDIMHYVHCYYKNKRGCQKCSDSAPMTLTDDKGEVYQIKKQKLANCYNLLISSMPLNNSAENHPKKFLDASNLDDKQKESLLDFLKGTQKTIISGKSLPQKNLD